MCWQLHIKATSKLDEEVEEKEEDEEEKEYEEEVGWMDSNHLFLSLLQQNRAILARNDQGRYRIDRFPA